MRNVLTELRDKESPQGGSWYLAWARVELVPELFGRTTLTHGLAWKFYRRVKGKDGIRLELITVQNSGRFPVLTAVTEAQYAAWKNQDIIAFRARVTPE